MFKLEQYQIPIYFITVVVAAFMAMLAPQLRVLEIAINPVLAVMLFATFLQVPLAKLGQVFRQFRFIGALLVANFVVIPIVVAILAQFLPPDPLIRFGVLLVLLTPCIDYVVTFSQIGRADARALLAATPLLLGAQMLLLPIYLGLLLDDNSRDLVRIAPFIHAFLLLIVLPLIFAGLVQRWARGSAAGVRVFHFLGFLPVPATALVLFVVVGSVVPQLNSAGASVLQVIPVYVVFAIVAPAIGLAVGHAFRLPFSQVRSIAFSAATRNSLVVLPLGLAIPGAAPVLPAIIVTQTLVELFSEIVYVRVLSRVGNG